MEKARQMNNQLQYGRITLRPLEPSDIDFLYLWENDLSIWELSNTKTPFSRHILEQYLMEADKDIYEAKQLRLIIQNDKLEVVGFIDLFDFDPYHLRAGVGILINYKQDRRKGYASDALNALCNYAREILGMRQLFANILDNNIASIQLFQNCGFKETGIKVDWVKSQSGWKDEAFFQKIFD